MAYVTVPKDLSRVKTKVALNLTKRQLICFSLAGVVGLPAYLISKSAVETDVAGVLMVCIMLPFFFFAMFEKDGFPAEKWLYHIIRKKFLVPVVRLYKTENIYTALVKQERIEQEVRKREARK